jgi:hypothetical protein
MACSTRGSRPRVVADNIHRRHRHLAVGVLYEWQTVDLAVSRVTRYTTIAKRPAVWKGYKVPKDVGEVPMLICAPKNGRSA